MMRSCLLILICCWKALVSAQALQPHTFRHIDQTDGLFHNSVRNIGQDKRGFIWILTLNGLQRYDGYRFVNYPEITRQSSMSIIGDSDLFVDTLHNLVWVFKGGKAERLNLEDNRMSSVQIEDLLKNGGSHEGDLYHLENGDQVLCNDLGYIYSHISLGLMPVGFFNSNPKQSHRNTNMVKEPRTDNFWMQDFYHLMIGNTQTRQMILSGANHPEHPLLRQMWERLGDDIRFRYLLLDSHGNLWISTWKEYIMRYNLANQVLHIYSLKDIRRKQPGHDDRNSTLLVQTMYEDRQGKLWIGTDFAGLLTYNHERDDFDYILSDEASPNGLRYSFTIYTIFQDRDDNIWVGTDRGINIFNPYKNDFQVHRPVQDHEGTLSKYSVTDVIETKAGEILVASWGGGIRVYDGQWNFIRNIPFEDVNEYSLVWCFVEHDDGMIWAGAQKGYIHQYDPVRHTVKTIHPEATENSTITTITKDREGNILLGLHNGHVAVWSKKENAFYKFDKLNTTLESSFPTIKNLYVDDANRCWTVTGSGLFEFDIGRRIYTGLYHPDSTDTSVGITFTGIEAYNDSLLIMGTNYRGLYLFNLHTKKFSKSDLFHSLNTTSVFAIKKDRMGHYWMTTDYRLMKVDPRQPESAIMNLDHTPVNSAFDAVGFYEMQDGRWLTNSSAEVFSFDPGSIRTNLDLTPDVRICGFRVFEKPLYIDSFLYQNKRVTLPHDENFITIEFSTLDFADVRQTNYAYRLTGINKDWIRTISEQKVEYTDLKPGAYLFEVKAEQGDGYSDTTSFPILIRPPWWGTWWFRISALLALGGVGYWMFKKRIHRIRQQSELRHRVAEMEMKALRAQMNPHFIFNCLSSIDNLIQTEQKEKATDYLAKFALLLRAILENSKANSIPCWKDLEALRLYLELETLRWEDQINCHLHVDPQIQDGDYKVPPLVIQPFVENAIHHGLLNKLDGLKKLDIDVHMEGHRIKYTITDNGVGRAQAAAYKMLNKLSRDSYGVQMTNERIGLFNQHTNGSVKITDLYDQASRPSGTMVEVWLNTQSGNS